LQRVSVPLKKADLLTVAQHVLGSVGYNRIPLLAKRHKVEIEKAKATPVEVLGKHISRYDENRLSRLLLEISLLDSAYRGSGDPDDDVLLETAKRHRIDAEKVQKAVAQEFAARQNKKAGRLPQTRPQCSSIVQPNFYSMTEGTTPSVVCSSNA